MFWTKSWTSVCCRMQVNQLTFLFLFYCCRRRKNFTPRTGFPIYTYLSSSKRLFFCVFASFIWPLIVFFPFLMVGFVLFFLSVYICHVINTCVDFCSLQLPRCWVHFNLLITWIYNLSNKKFSWCLVTWCIRQDH